MIILLRLRNLTLFALAVLSLSLIYMGYTGFEKGDLFAEQDDMFQEDVVTIAAPALGTDLDIAKMLDSQSSVDIEELKKYDDFFVEFRMKRDRGRDKEIEILREIVNNPNTSEEIRHKAQNKMFAISASISAEAKAENLLKAKGYEEGVVLVEADKTTVVVSKKNLTQTDITKIGELITRATGCKLEEVAIIPKQ
ncbi:MAG: SpoIIIAH-like family protein [Bacillota bacterium]